MELDFKEPSAREKRPSWESVPQDIVKQIEIKINDKIISGEISWGGFSNSAAFKVTTSSGKKFFIKGSHPDQDAHGVKTLQQEIYIYKTIPAIENIAPNYIAEVSDGNEDSWYLSVFEYIDTVPVLPWTKEKILKVFKTLKFLHSCEKKSLDKNFPQARSTNYVERYFQPQGGWLRIKNEEKIYRKFITLFADKNSAEQWCANTLGLLAEYQMKANDIGGVEGVIHQDLRSDNILFTPAGKSYLIDFPNCCYGPVVMDLAFFLPSVMSEADFDFLTLLGWYKKTCGIDINHDALILALVSISGHLADSAYRAIPEKLPRLRWMQRKILWQMLQCLVVLLNIEQPPKFADE